METFFFFKKGSILHEGKYIFPVDLIVKMFLEKMSPCHY